MSESLGIEREYVMTPTLELFHNSNAFARGIMGPVGSGKSTACTMEIGLRARQQEPGPDGIRRTRWAVVRNTFPELRTTTLKTWKEWFPEYLVPVNHTSPMTARLQGKLDDGTKLDAEVVFIAMDKPRDLRKLLSFDVTGIWINEARELSEKIVARVTERVGRFPPARDGGPTWHGFWMDTNPPDDDHWWYRLAEIEQPKGWDFFRQPGGLIRKIDGSYMPNPLAENVQNLPGKYNYYYQMLPGHTQEEIKVSILGQYASLFDGRPVYAGTWDESIHFSQEPIKVLPGLPLIMGWDFGLTPACIIGQLSPKGCLNILREVICEEGALREFVREAVRPMLLNEFPNMRILSSCDPAGKQRSQVDAQTCIGELERAGIPTVPAATNDFIPRRQAVIAFLRRTKGFLLDPSCQILRKGFNGGYQFQRVQVTGEERYKDIPNKNRFSHCIAKGSLIETSRGRVPIEDVVVGDMALTPLGYKRVSRSWLVRDNAEVYEIETKQGYKLRATSDHLVFANGHWTKVDALQYNSILYGISIYPSENIGDMKWEGLQNTQFKHSMESNIIGRRLDITRPISELTSEQDICTEMFGNITMDQYQMGSKCITKTGIKETTISKTSRASKLKHMLQDMPSRTTRIPQILPEEALLPQEKRQKSGMLPKLEGDGTANMDGIHGKTGKSQNTNVRDAERNTKPTQLQESVVFVPPIAKLLHGKKAGLITKQDAAQSVEVNLSQISIQKRRRALNLVGVKRCREVTEVYDLTVEDAHCFYANGILVHNCHDALQYLCLAVDEPVRATEEPQYTHTGRSYPEPAVKWGAFT